MTFTLAVLIDRSEVIGRAAWLETMPSSFGFHRMPSSCARGATASGGVTFMRAFSSLIPTEYLYLIHRLLSACLRVYSYMPADGLTHGEWNLMRCHWPLPEHLVFR